MTSWRSTRCCAPATCAAWSRRSARWARARAQGARARSAAWPARAARHTAGPPAHPHPSPPRRPQFVEAGCDNCRFLRMDDDRDAVANLTTPNFTGCARRRGRVRSRAGACAWVVRCRHARPHPLGLVASAGAPALACPDAAPPRRAPSQDDCCHRAQGQLGDALGAARWAGHRALGCAGRPRLGMHARSGRAACRPSGCGQRALTRPCAPPLAPPSPPLQTRWCRAATPSPSTRNRRRGCG
jgi:hypothetical protein